MLFLAAILSSTLLTNAADVAAAVLAQRADSAFSLQGTIVASSERNEYPVVLADGSGCMTFRFELADRVGHPLRAGDRVRIEGRTRSYQNEFVLASCERMTTLGSGRPIPPQSLSLADLKRGLGDNRLVRIGGKITEIFRDEIAPRWTFFTIEAEGRSVYATVRDDCIPQQALSHLLYADVVVTGVSLPVENGSRRLIGRTVQLLEPDALTVIAPPPDDPFDVADLDSLPLGNPEDVRTSGRRQSSGRTIARWGENNVLIRTHGGKVHRIELASADRPAVGSWIRAVGTPETDLYRLNLSNAIWRDEPPPENPPPDSTPRDLADLIRSDDEAPAAIKAHHYGQLVHLSGRVIDRPSGRPFRLLLRSSNLQLTIDASSAPEALAGIVPGCQVEATGVYLAEVDNWSPGAPFPHVRNALVVLRDETDVRILSRPTWWTPGRLTAVVIALFTVLVVIFAWNRFLNRLVERRSRELFRVQVAHAGESLRVEERTRIAVELHDSLSQFLTGIAFQIDAAVSIVREDLDSATQFLAVAKRTLLSCREELRRCLWDLRNHSLEDADFEEAIRRTVRPGSGGASVIVDFRIPRAGLSDTTAHAILCIVRELAVNAVRHGGATEIHIAGNQTDGRVCLSVEDNGRGFDPLSRPGPGEGHFGLQGIRERLVRLGGGMKIDSAPGRGTRILVEIGK